VRRVLRQAVWILMLPVLSGPLWAKDFQWDYQGRQFEVRIPVSSEAECRLAYERDVHPSTNAERYVVEDPCGAYVKILAARMRDMARESGFRRLEAITWALNFVTTIPYAYDEDSKQAEDYWRFASETLLDGTGDCEDNAILFTALMSHWCIDSALVRTTGHMAAAVNGKEVPALGSDAAIFPFAGSNYAYAESTGCKTGDCGHTRLGEIQPLGESHRYPDLDNPEGVYRVPLYCTHPLPMDEGVEPEWREADRIFEEEKQEGFRLDFDGEDRWFKGQPRRLTWEGVMKGQSLPQKLLWEDFR